MMPDLKICFTFTYFPTSCSHLVGQGHIAGQLKFISVSYLPFNDGKTALYTYY